MSVKNLQSLHHVNVNHKITSFSKLVTKMKLTRIIFHAEEIIITYKNNLNHIN